MLIKVTNKKKAKIEIKPQYIDKDYFFHCIKTKLKMNYMYKKLGIKTFFNKNICMDKITILTLQGC